MISPLGNKSFHEDDQIIVDPDQSPNNGCFVIAFLSNAKEAPFKQFVVDGGVKYLKPLNPHYPLIEINKKK